MLANHNVELMETKELNDEEVAYRYRCCGELMTDAWVTVRVTLPVGDQNQAVKTHIDNLKTRHEAKLQWRQRVQAGNAGGNNGQQGN